MVEHLLTTNEYLEPKTLKGADAYGTLLFRLLILQPGENPLHPRMGVGLGPKYRFISEDGYSVSSGADYFSIKKLVICYIYYFSFFKKAYRWFY